MFRRHWREGEFWRWWWANRVPLVAKVLAAVVLVNGVLAGGWFAANGLNPATASDSASGYIVETTGKRVMTVHEHGKVVRKIVPVVKRVFVRPQTSFLTQTVYQRRTVTIRGAVRVVRRPVVRYVSKVTTRVVTLSGKTKTVVETQVVPTTETFVKTAVITSQQTVVQPVTQTQTQTQTVTQIATQTVTNFQTITVATTVIETVPLITVTVRR